MTPEEEEAAVLARLARSYRVRIVLELMHGEHTVSLRGATMADARDELGAVTRPLVAHLLMRLLERLEHTDA